MNRQYFTMNPAHPHPDDDSEPEPMTLPDAARFALRVLRDPNADQWLRQKAATELTYSLDVYEDNEK